VKQALPEVALECSLRVRLQTERSSRNVRHPQKRDLVKAIKPADPNAHILTAPFEKRSGRSVQAAIFFHAGMNTFQSSSCYYQSVFALMFICADLRW